MLRLENDICKTTKLFINTTDVPWLDTVLACVLDGKCSYQWLQCSTLTLTFRPIDFCLPFDWSACAVCVSYAYPVCRQSLTTHSLPSCCLLCSFYRNQCLPIRGFFLALSSWSQLPPPICFSRALRIAFL